MLTIINPATDRVIGDIETDTPSEIAHKFTRARRASPRWAAVPFADRAAAVARFADLVGARAGALADILVRETGKPVTQARCELDAARRRIHDALRRAPARLAPRVLEGQALPGMADAEEVVTYEPLGVVCHLSAWTAPWLLGGSVWAPALLAGCAIVYKPSEHATLSGLAAADLLHEAGVPEDVFQRVLGGPEAGAGLLEHPFDGVFFSGCHRTGVRVAQAAVRHLARVHLDLGGKDAAYVCDDADLAVAATVADAAFRNAGQSCRAIARVYAHRALYDVFVTAFTDLVRAFPVGDPAERTTFVGPLGRTDRIDLLDELVRDAVDRGARLLCGGERMARPGSFYAPTVLADCTPEMRVMREPAFGPVVGLAAADDDDHACRLMADNAYGQAATVFTPDRLRAAALLSRLDVGVACWNDPDPIGAALPWAGRGRSGLGAFGGDEGFDAFLRPKGWHLRRA